MAGEPSGRQRLEARGIAFSEDEFIRCIREGRADVCELFLSAGISADASRDGEAAVVAAAKNDRKEIVRLLLAAGADPAPLADALRAGKSRKDWWDKLASLSGVLTFTSSVIIASVGTAFTYLYNQRQQDLAAVQAASEQRIKLEQNRLIEMQTVEKMIPHLQDERSRQVALVAISELASVRVASRLGEMFGGKESVKALEQIAGADARKPTPAAVSALAGLAARKGEDAIPAREALAAVFAGKDRAVVTLSDGKQAFCNGFVADAASGWIVTPGYCLEALRKGKTLSVQSADGAPLAVKTTRLSADGLVALINVESRSLSELPLAAHPAEAGEIVMRLAFDLTSPVRGVGNARVAIGRVVKVEATQLSVAGGGQILAPAVHVATPEGDVAAGSAGGPILDREGRVACMVYQGDSKGYNHCLPASVISQALAAAKRG